LFQLFAPGYGNPALLPENSKNLSISIEHKFSDQFFTALTYFDSQFENFIEYSNPTYKNIARARTVGVESQTQANFLDGSLRLSLNLGYQEPKDLSKANKPWLVRRPLRTASFKVSSDVTADLNLGAEVIHTGEKLDKAGSPMPQYPVVEDYTLLNVYGNYQLVESTAIFARVDNIENKDYQTTYGFYNQGSVYKLGAQFSF
jgi:vitamin B12 transporter